MGIFDSYRGHSFEDALALWSDPEAFAGKRVQISLLKFQSNRTEGLRRLREITTDLQADLFAKLLRGELQSSCSDLSLSSRRMRRVLPAETYALPGLCYDWQWDMLRSDEYTFQFVEFFLPDKRPSNVDAGPEQMGEVTSGLPQWKPELSVVPDSAAEGRRTGFEADSTFEHVRLGDRMFSLSKFQASVVEHLHLAHKSGEPWLEAEELRSQIGFQTAKLSGLFRRLPDWRDLIQSDGRGRYRLNIRD